MFRSRALRMVLALVVGLSVFEITGCAAQRNAPEFRAGGVTSPAFGRRGRKGRRNRRPDLAPAHGSAAPNFVLTSLDKDRTVELASFNGKKPVVLVFGSYT